MNRAVFACLLMLLPAPAFADMPGSFTANLTLTSDYVFRGVSQSDEHPALQGSVDWWHDLSGLYAGVWASSLDLPDVNAEFDLYAGISGARHFLTWDLGAIYYLYPGADSDLDYDFAELAAAAGYDFTLFSVSAALNYSPDYFGKAKQSLYPAVYLNVPLPYELNLTAGAGQLWAQDADDRTNWSLGLGAEVYGFSAGVAYQDTSRNCGGRCDERLVFSLGRTF